jgi:hypothetical protein
LPAGVCAANAPNAKTAIVTEHMKYPVNIFFLIAFFSLIVFYP